MNSHRCTHRCREATLVPDLAVVVSKPASATCFCGSEILLPLGYRKGRCLQTSDFYLISPVVETTKGDGRSFEVSLPRESATTCWRTVRPCPGPLLRTFSVVFISHRGAGYEDVRSASRGRRPVPQKLLSAQVPCDGHVAASMPPRRLRPPQSALDKTRRSIARAWSHS